MPRGYFLVAENKEISWDIKCELHHEYAKEQVPQDQAELYIEIEQVNNVIRELKYTAESRKKEYSQKLLTLAQAGLIGETAQPNLAKLSLKELKEEILIREGGRIKNKYMIKLGIIALALGFISIIIGASILDNCYKTFSAYFFVWAGAMAGTWISFGVRKISIRFEDLHMIEEDRMNPFIRLMFIGLTSVLLLLFLKSGIVTITVGTFNSVSIDTNIEFQLLLGSIAGLAEYKLTIDLFNKASSILKLSNSSNNTQNF